VDEKFDILGNKIAIGCYVAFPDDDRHSTWRAALSIGIVEKINKKMLTIIRVVPMGNKKKKHIYSKDTIIVNSNEVFALLIT